MTKLVLVTVLALIGVSLAVITPEQQQLLRDTNRYCLEQTSADPALIRQTRQGVFSSDPTLAKYFLCFLKKTNVLDANGNFQRDALTTYLTTANGPVVANQILGNCLVLQSTPEQTAIQYLKCAHKYRLTPNVS